MIAQRVGQAGQVSIPVQRRQLPVGRRVELEESGGLAELGGDVKKVGVITAEVAASWPKGEKPPTDEGGKTIHQDNR